MRIAVFNAFPVARFTAEKEFITRCLRLLRRMGHDMHEVFTSTQVIDCCPDFVLATHDFVPKLTRHFTVGVLWSPTNFYRMDRERLRNIGSWDLIVPINDETRQFAEDLQFSLGRPPAVCRHFFYPSSAICDVPLPEIADLSLVYVGVHWDGPRHESLFRELAKAVDFSVYGPPEAWKNLPEAYRGSIPYGDGDAVVRTLNRHGAVLALHKSAHRLADTPSMRVFEGCAAKCLVITDPMTSLQQRFGSAIEYISPNLGIKGTVQQIAALMKVATQDPVATARRIEAAHRVFSEQASLDALLPALIEAVKERIELQRRSVVTASAPTVSVIMRCGNRAIRFVRRAVRSIERQSYPNIALIFVRFGEIEGFSDFTEELRQNGRFRMLTVAAVDGSKTRSAALWAGLRMVETPFFANLDDDDEWHPDHLHHIMEGFSAAPGSDIVFAGCIRHEEEGITDKPHPRLTREDGSFVEEPRKLAHFSQFDLGLMMQRKNMIASHAFVARSALLTREVLQDPQLELMEDLFLYLLLAARGATFRFNGRPTAVWNCRAKTQDNSENEFDYETKLRLSERIARRLGLEAFPIGLGAADSADLLAADNIYDATEEDGMDFRRPGLPSFIARVTGLYEREAWGRWTNGPVMRVHFSRPLPKRFELELRGYPFGRNRGRDIIVRTGDCSAVFRMTRQLTTTYRIPIRNDAAADMIEIHVPLPSKPSAAGNSDDTRDLGLALVSLRIRPQRSSLARRLWLKCNLTFSSD